MWRRENVGRRVCDTMTRRLGSAAEQGILFLPAWQQIAVQKACQSPRRPSLLER